MDLYYCEACELFGRADADQAGVVFCRRCEKADRVVVQPYEAFLVQKLHALVGKAERIREDLYELKMGLIRR